MTQDAHTQADPAAPLTAAPEACQDEQSNRCTGEKKDGTRCKTTVGLKDGLCAYHRGATDPLRANRAKHDQEAARRAEAEAAAARRSLTLKQALAERAAAERDAIVDALFAPLHDEDASATAKQQAARVILERILGRPGEIPAEEQQQGEMSLEDLVEAWRAHRDAPDAGTPVAQGDDAARMGTGLTD